MTSQPSEPVARTTTRPSAAASAPEQGDHMVQALLLKRQVAELERRLAAITESERKTRADLLEALGASQAFAREQARLHEELATRERLVAEIISREDQIKSQLSEAQTNARKSGADLAKAIADLAAVRSRAERPPAHESAAVETSARLSRLAGHVDQRARILGYIAGQMRQERHRLVALQAALDRETQALSTNALAELHSERARSRVALDAALAARRAGNASEQKLRDERWQVWTSSFLPPRGAPRRRNRPAKLMEKILSRLGPPGVAAALNGSGLWNSDFQCDNRPSARRATLLSYAGARANPDVPMKALFDQRYYLAANPSVAGSGLAPLAHYLIHGDRENRNPHPLIDVAWYRARNRHELDSTGLTVLQHFLFIGAAKGLNPHPLFDVRHYVGQLSDPADQAMNPLVHYLRTGWRRGFNPHPLFENDGYLRRYPVVADQMIPPLLHYVTDGARNGLDPHALFFSHWYQSAYPDVLTSGQLPLAHFLDRGLTERRNPNPFFSSDHYLRSTPDAYSAGLDPLHHYVAAGAWHGASPNPDFDAAVFLATNPQAINAAVTPLESWIAAGRPALAPPTQAPTIDAAPHRATMLLLFDAAWYFEQAGDLLSATDDPLDHYLATGWRLGLNPHRLFDTAWYLGHHPEALASGLPPLLHFVTSASPELRDPHPLFDSRWYAERYPDVLTGGEIPLVHYIHFGGKEGRSPGPLFDAQAYLRAYPDVRGLDPLVHFLSRWPFDNRPDSFASPAAGSPQGVNAADWIAGLADSLAQTSRTLDASISE